jgi:hypothetical protein
MDEIFDQDWQAMIIRFLFHVLVVFIVTRLFYYHNNRGKPALFFTYISISSLVFIICLVLSRVPVELGFALGLFAIFSIIRFRSIQLSARELTYLFISIGLAVYNSLTNIDTSIIRIIVGNILILSIVGSAEYFLFRTGKMTKYITYDRIDLVGDDRRTELEQDIEDRFGISNISKIQFGDIDVLKTRVKLKVTFFDKTNKNFQEE